MKKQTIYRISLMVISLAMVMALVAAALPQPAQAATISTVITDIDKNATFTAYIQNGRVFVTLGGFKAKQVFKVKVRDAGKSVPWYILGTVKVAKKATVNAVYPLPTQMSKLTWVSVCVKQQNTDKLVCLKVANPGS